MKGTLRKVNEGIVFTIDERPKIGNFGYNTKIGKCLEYDNRMYLFVDYSDHKILASTFGVGLELWLDYECSYMPLSSYYKKIQNKLLNTEYIYTIEDGKVIVEL
jgi:hypothetical protein